MTGRIDGRVDPDQFSDVLALFEIEKNLIESTARARLLNRS